MENIPSATYRLQFNKDFRFEHAREILPYLKSLGISHVYASPIFFAMPGSMHGYDVRDLNRLNPELGSEEDFELYVQALQEREIGQILDFVPNHMGVNEGENPFWMDVLEHGPSSRYAGFFDIDWQPIKPELANKVLLPVLGTQYGVALEAGHLKLHFDGSCFTVSYYETKFPICMRTSLPILQFARNRIALDSENENLAEYHSILTALKNMPPAADTDPTARVERARETTVTKRRLANLCGQCEEIRNAINHAVEKWQVVEGDTTTCDALDQLLTAQSYRLSYWRVAGEEINYRRFFDVNSLAAIRMELPEVFEATHKLVTELLRTGKATGLRIDHVDGLADCDAYLTRLQQRYCAVKGIPYEEKALFLLVEKILTGHEKLRQAWPVHGTTGYEFANQVISVLIDSSAERALTEIYQQFTGRYDRWEQIVYRSKGLVSVVSMAGEINYLGHMLNQLAQKTRCYRDFTLNALIFAIREVVACFPIYRTYMIPGEPISEEDRRMINKAISGARAMNPSMDRSIFEFLRDVVLVPTEQNQYVLNAVERGRFITKFQQVTGPLTAKGVEDTASYIFNRLVALNEVGGEPDEMGQSVEQFHRKNNERLASFPHSMLTTSTHDTKRSEDVRARIAAISERPLAWRQSVKKWRILNRQHKIEVDGRQAPDGNEEYLLYQTLVGSWPFEAVEQPITSDYVARIQNYMLKAMREAKVNSNWIEPHQRWEEAVKGFVHVILTDKRARRFRNIFRTAAAEFARLGAINSLSQTLLKLTVPGMPDVYQGTELWDLSLVDPDNRRPVDYSRRRGLLASLDSGRSSAELLEHWTDGRIKLFLTATTLRFRRENPALFAQGRYEPVAAQGEFKDHLVAFRRCTRDRQMVVCVPRLTDKLGFPPIGGCWKDTEIEVSGVGAWKDIFTSRKLDGTKAMPLSSLFAELPFALLEGTEEK